MKPLKLIAVGAWAAALIAAAACGIKAPPKPPYPEAAAPPAPDAGCCVDRPR